MYIFRDKKTMFRCNIGSEVSKEHSPAVHIKHFLGNSFFVSFSATKSVTHSVIEDEHNDEVPAR